MCTKLSFERIKKEMDQDIKLKKDIDAMNISEDNSTEPVVSSTKGVLVLENDSDSDFGNFSDASVEIDNSVEDQEKDEDSYITTQLDSCLTLLFDQKHSLILNSGDRGKGSDENGKDKNKTDVELFSLEDLIEEERPHVIYEQLFSGRLHTQLFNWKQSYIRSTLLHILGVEQENEENEHADISMRRKKRQEPLDDSLYIKLCHLLESDQKFIHYNTMILKDYFNFIYSPRFTQPSHDSRMEEEQLEAKRENDNQNNTIHSTNDHDYDYDYDYNFVGDDDKLNTQIPKLLNQGNDSSGSGSSASGDTTLCDIEEMTNDELQKYHDQLCNVIDLLMVKLKRLNKLQTDLTQDKTIFENVVTNLSGHTQRLQRDEIELYNKKFGHKLLRNQRNKRFSWGGL